MCAHAVDMSGVCRVAKIPCRSSIYPLVYLQNPHHIRWYVPGTYVPQHIPRPIYLVACQTLSPNTYTISVRTIEVRAGDTVLYHDGFVEQVN